MISVGVGRLNYQTQSIEFVASQETERVCVLADVKLLPEIDALLADTGVSRDDRSVRCMRAWSWIVYGRAYLHGKCEGYSYWAQCSLYLVFLRRMLRAWQQWDLGVRGSVVVVGDAMRKEVYPVRYMLTDGGVEQLKY